MAERAAAPDQVGLRRRALYVLSHRLRRCRLTAVLARCARRGGTEVTVDRLNEAIMLQVACRRHDQVTTAVPLGVHATQVVGRKSGDGISRAEDAVPIGVLTPEERGVQVEHEV